MRLFSSIRSFASAIFRRSLFEHDMDEELLAHIRDRARDLERSGMPRDEAERRARLDFGGYQNFKEECREAVGTHFVESIMQDVRFALRMLRKSPGFSTVAILTLALGIGANTAIFSAVNGILLKPLPYANSSRLVNLDGFKRFPGGIEASMDFPVDIWEKVRAQTPAIAQMGLWSRRPQVITGQGAPELISVARVSSEFFSVLGVKPLAGRPILFADTQPGAKPVAVVSYAFWRARWGESDTVLNQTITLDDKNYIVVGVMPPGFTYPILTVQSNEGVWIPLVLSPAQKSSEASAGFPIARLKNGVSLAQANAQLETVSTRVLSKMIPKQLAGVWAGTYIVARPLEKHFSDLDEALVILLGAVGFVLLIACTNVSALLLARGWARLREVAIRQALGASRVRIVRQLLTESALLALCGGAVGLAFCFWAVHLLRAITPSDLPEHGHFDLNANILWFTLVVSLVTGVLFGLGPALQASTRRVAAAIHGGFASVAGTSSRLPRRLRSALVVVEIALAVILVVGATLVARSFEKLTAVKLGFRTDHIITMDANFSTAVCNRNDAKSLTGCKVAISDVLHRMRQIPGVQSAALCSGAPLVDWGFAADFKIERETQDFSLNTGAQVASRSISTGYFRTFGIPLLSGREFTAADTSGAERVVIVDRAFATKYLGNHPLGRRISTEEDKNGKPLWMQVVGIVESTRDTDLQYQPSGEIYVPYEQSGHFQRATFIARTVTDPAVMLSPLRRAVWSEDKEAPITDVGTMDQIVSSSVAEPRFRAGLLGSFAALGLILAMVGIYGVISFGVTQRTREIGVCMALGAQPANVLRMIVGEGMVLAVVGIAMGVAGALALTRFLRSLLFEIKPTDPVTFASVAILLIFVSFLACYIPARRAMRVDPASALRCE